MIVILVQCIPYSDWNAYMYWNICGVEFCIYNTCNALPSGSPFFFCLRITVQRAVS